MLEQMQPLLVSDLFVAGARVREGPVGLGLGMRAHSCSPRLRQMASSGSAKALAGQGELTRQVEELQQKLDEEVKVRTGWGSSKDGGLQGKKTLAWAGSSKRWNEHSGVPRDATAVCVLAPARIPGLLWGPGRSSTPSMGSTAFHSVWRFPPWLGHILAV